MSVCGTIIRSVSWFERQSQILTSRVCSVEYLKTCAAWAEDVIQYCAQKADEGYNECCDWPPCSWFCDALVWISKWVCIAFGYIVKYTCLGLYYVYEAICYTVISFIFWVIRHTVNYIVTIPCSFGDPSLDPRIRHIFVLVLENRSFDHMFGETRIPGTDAETGTPTEIQTRPSDASNDVRDADVATSRKPASWVMARRDQVDDDPGHGFGGTLLQLSAGGRTVNRRPIRRTPITNSGFAQNFADKVLNESPPGDPSSIMLSYTEGDVPVITALAREFAICDNWYSSMPGPTFPNRCFFHAASSAGLDDTPTDWDEGLFKATSGLMFENGTIYDMLDSENIDWKVYHGNPWPQVFELAGMDWLTGSATSGAWTISRSICRMARRLRTMSSSSQITPPTT